jgi:chitinase
LFWVCVFYRNQIPTYSFIHTAVPSYGHSYIVDKTNAFKNKTTGSRRQGLKLYPTFEVDEYPAGDAWDDAPGVDNCGNLGTQGGNWDFWGMIKGGFLNEKGKPLNDKAITYLFDSCSKTVSLI